MKKVFIKLLVILVIPAFYFVFVSAFNRNDISAVSQVSSPDPYKFDNIIMNTDYRIVQSGNGGLWIGNNLDKYKELGFNAVHVYPCDNDVYGQFPILLTYPQKQNNADLIRSVKESGLNFFYEHVFFSYLCYAQRLVYLVHKPGETNQTNNGFCYQTANGTLITQPGNDTTVLYVQQQQNPQYTLVCGDIYENLQHSDYFGRQHDKDVNWYVKPMMKLDANNLSDDTPVFRIVYFNFNGDSISNATRTIYARNFKNGLIYNGEYTDRFYDESGNPIVFSISGDETTTGLNYGRPSGLDKEACHVDFKIYTYGQANFWLKKVTVDDFYANNLFNPEPQNNYDNIIQNELQYIGSDPNLYSYYMDEQTYSQLPCIKYVMDKIDEYNQANNTNIKFMVAGSNWQAVNMYRKTDFGHTLTLNALHPRIMYIFSYEMYECSGVDHTYIPIEALGSNNIDSRIKTEWKANYNTYNDYLQNFVLGDKNSGYTSSHPQGSFIYQVALAKNNIINVSSESRLMVGEQLQGEMWMDGNYLTGIREPLNEEIEVQIMSALSHGAQSLIGYLYPTYGYLDENSLQHYIYGFYGRETQNENYTRRYVNLYGENKWDYMKNLNAKINSWIQTLEEITWQEGYSIHSEGANHNYILDIKSIFRDPSGNFIDDPGCTYCDVTKYWEEGFFTPINTNDKSKYLLMVNRRCAPEVNEINAGDLRNLKIKFNPSELPDFNNWVLKNVENNDVVVVIDKNSNSYYDIGVFLPGEGKLFQIAPVMQEGGTFVCNEEVINQQFVYKGLVNTGGFDLTIKSENSGQTIISFKQNCGIFSENNGLIHIEGASSNNKTIFQGYSTDKWNGIYANNCEILDISFSEFKNLNGNWTVSAYNCEQIYVSSCHFDLAENNSKAINVNNSSDDISFAFIDNNQINVTSPTAAICLIATGSCEIYSIIENNVITSTEGSNYGIFLSNNYSPLVSDNFISGFDAGMRILGTDIILSDNTITSNISDSYGIFASVSSQLKMGYFEGDIFGRNQIANYGNGCNNIKLDNSVFFVDLGQNALDVNTGSNSYNMFGTGEFETSGDGPVEYIEAKENCFNGPGNNAVYSIQHYESPNTYYSLHELPHYCTFEQDMIADYIYPKYNNLTDTVFRLVNTPELTSNSKILNKNLMKTFLQRNYDSARYISTVLLNTYYDSIFTPPVIKILYLSSSNLDTAGEQVTALKTFLEQLILNHSQNVSLVKSAYYYIQKCKVQLHQYTSALTGFQDIMVQNPYGYEGLMASWDYAATQLLANSGGSHADNDMNSLQWLNIFSSERQLLNDTLRLTKILKTDKYDNNVFSKEDRKLYIKSVGNVLSNEREKQIEKVKNLEEKFERTNEKEKNLIKKELDEAKVLNSVIKTKTPKDDNEYIMIINNDLEKIGRKSSDIEKGNNNNIPVSYELKQNYPNPFNPVTKISFALPKESKVKLIIYDMLGREVARLINNENLSAGTHIREFNGSNLSSGVYFLRILVNDGKDFSDVKKIVLLK